MSSGASPTQTHRGARCAGRARRCTRRWGALAFSLLLCACGRPAGTTPEPGPVTLKVLYLPYTSFAPLYIAQQEGFFREQGIEVAFTQSASGTDLLPAFLHGDIDVYGGALSAGLLNAMARGEGFGIVADKGFVGPDDGFYAMVARKELAESGRLASAAHWKGLRIAYTPTAFFEYILDRILRARGLAVADIRPVKIRGALLQEALARGEIDLAFPGEPWITQLVESGAGVVQVHPHAITGDAQYGVLAFGPELTLRRPEVGRRFMVAYLKGIRRYLEGKSERNVALLARQTGMDSALVRRTAWPPFRSDGRVLTRSLVEFQQWGLAQGYVDRAVQESRLVDHSFVDHANQVLAAAPASRP
jgi:NitT/TauT family transport system substrate-binding protein